MMNTKAIMNQRAYIVPARSAQQAMDREARVHAFWHDLLVKGRCYVYTAQRLTSPQYLQPTRAGRQMRLRMKHTHNLAEKHSVGIARLSIWTRFCGRKRTRAPQESADAKHAIARIRREP